MSYLATIGKLSVTKASTKANVTVSSFYSDKPAVIYFIRRFGCSICRWSAKVSHLIDIRVELLVLEKVNQSYTNPNHVSGLMVFIGHEEIITRSRGQGQCYRRSA